MTRRQNFTEKEKSTIFRMKSNNCTRKSISLALNACPKSVDSVIRRDRLNDGLPPKEKKSRSTITRRLALLIKRVVKENPQIPYRDIPAKVREILGTQETLTRVTRPWRGF